MDFFHTGVLVASLEAATAELSAMGLHWREIVVYDDMTVWTPAGELRSALRRIYSVEGPPYVELIEEPAGIIFGNAGQPGGDHHLGFWSTDIDAEAESLEQCGYQRTLAGLNADGTIATAVFLRASSGPLVELIPTSRRDAVLGTGT
jgi:hypothetical protein